MKKPKRQSTNQATPFRARDIDLNYYLRATASTKRRQPVAQPKAMNITVHQIPDQIAFHLGQQTRYATYAFLAYIGVITACSLSQFKDNNNNNNNTKAKKDTGQPDSETHICSSSKPKSESGELTGATPTPHYHQWSSPFSRFLSFLNVLSLPTLPFKAHIPDNSVELNATESENREAEGLSELITVPKFNTIAETLSASVSSTISALSHLWSSPAQATSILTIRTRTCKTNFSDNVNSVATSRIGSSLEDCWDENSPIINPRIPNQLRSLLTVPELCV